MLKVILNKNEEQNILNGYPWVFSNEVNRFIGNIKNGEIVSVYTFDNLFLAYGFLNTSSKIIVRILSLKENEEINYSFFENRIKEAINHRNILIFKNNARLIFSEADFLPGLVVDKYADVLVCQFMSLGMDNIKEMIIDILVKLLNPVCIYERSDMPIRLKEGLPLTKGILYGKLPDEVIINENDILMKIDIEEGQKTGYFLDQKLNRDYLKHFVKDKTVLDCFSHTGGFALNAIKNGALKVVACDISSHACSDIMYNAKLNNFNNIEAICVDVFDYLRNDSNYNLFDCIILDPPAFTKSKETITKAYKGYKEINLQALKIIKSEGYLFTFSCSQHMTMDLFLEMIKDAVKDSKRKVQFLDLRIQSFDHPALLQSEEQLYLKCIVLRVL